MDVRDPLRARIQNLLIAVWFASGNHNLLAVGGKEGVVYLMDADALGDKDHQTPLFTTPMLGNDDRTFEAKGIWGRPFGLEGRGRANVGLRSD